MSTAVQIHTGDPSSNALTFQRPPVTLLRPIAAPSEVLQAQEATRALVTEILKDGRDYGVIPGTDKPTMLKPGAERTALAFGCYYGDPEIVEREVDHDRVVQWRKTKAKWEGSGKDRKKVGTEETTGESLGLYRYVLRVPVISRETGLTVGFGIGSCSTMESKYIDRPRDSENTALKMAHKRALVSACLVTFGLSDQFTQDVEDLPHGATASDGDPTSGQPAANEPVAKCPTCSGLMWDNRGKKTNPKAPDFKCRDKSCDGVYWPGQWPPKPEAKPEPTTTTTGNAPSAGTDSLATDEQKRRIATLLNRPDLDLVDEEREKTAKIAGKPTLTQKRAAEIIAGLEKLVPVGLALGGDE